MTKFGVIGGSGFYQMKEIKVLAEHDLNTPFGKPSDKIIEADLSVPGQAKKVAYFLPRHGRGHRFNPSEVNYRANVHALKQLGVTHLLSVSAVGIMKEHIQPGDMVVVDQFYDRTKGLRPSTFFCDGIVGHVQFADPVCSHFSNIVYDGGLKHTKRIFNGGTYVCIEGPHFSTRAESRSYLENLKPVVIGMTALTEAKLAREAEMCYAVLALATDYDCWHETEEDVSVEAVLKVVHQNTDLANRIVRQVALNLPQQSKCNCQEAAKFAIMTAKEAISPEVKNRLKTILGKYF